MKILIRILVIMIILIGISACQDQQTLKQETLEIPSDWKSYKNEEIGISFYYPSEWGDITEYKDHEDYLKREEPKKYQVLSKQIETGGKHLFFSDFDKSYWGPQIRVTSVQKIVNVMSEFLSLQKEAPEKVQYFMDSPFLGMTIPYAVLTPQIVDKFPKMIEDIAKLPQGASAEVLKQKARPVFMLFANGLRYMVESHEESGRSGEVIGSLKAKRSQIVTADGNLKGVVEIGTEGWDVAARDYWDCILTIPKENDLIIYVSFTLKLPSYGAWQDPSKWETGERPPGTEELMKQQLKQFETVVKSIKLLK